MLFRPLETIARAWASTDDSLGCERRKLQLLQPIAGVRPTPLVPARAAGAAQPPAPASAATAHASARHRPLPLLCPPLVRCLASGPGNPDGRHAMPAAARVQTRGRKWSGSASGA